MPGLSSPRSSGVTQGEPPSQVPGSSPPKKPSLLEAQGWLEWKHKYYFLWDDAKAGHTSSQRGSAVDLPRQQWGRKAHLLYGERFKIHSDVSKREMCRRFMALFRMLAFVQCSWIERENKRLEGNKNLSTVICEWRGCGGLTLPLCVCVGQVPTREAEPMGDLYEETCCKELAHSVWGLARPVGHLQGMPSARTG